MQKEILYFKVNSIIATNIIFNLMLIMSHISP
nr:MAG TPA: hypothetical protein [Bacteriophage sp.]